METKENILSFLKSNKEDFFDKFYLAKLGLFGSYSTNTNSANSDIDIIVEFKPDTKNLFELKKELKSIISQQFGKEVDICREKYIKPYFKHQILSSTIYV